VAVAARRDTDVFSRSARLALVVLVPAILFTMLVGDELGVIEAKYQPMKIAAAEAQWTTCQPCSFSLFQIGGGNQDQTPTQIIAIPHLLSLLATNHWDGKVVGLNPLQSQYSQQYGPGCYVPNVFIQYWAMRVMAYAGVLVFLLSLWGQWLARRRNSRSPGGSCGWRYGPRCCRS
jgi:cytochrome d ubiquinol oxidase subunit I